MTDSLKRTILHTVAEAMRGATGEQPRDAGIDPRSPSRSRTDISGTSTRTGLDVPKGYTVAQARVVKPHQSIYAAPEVFDVLRDIARREGIKPQELYREGLRLVLRKRGYDFDALDQDRRQDRQRAP